MPRLYVASTEPRAGKTLLVAALALRVKAQERQQQTRVAYLKPLRLLASDDGDTPDADATLIHDALDLDGKTTDLVADTAPIADVADVIREPDKARKALTRLEKSNDLVLLEGLTGLQGDELLSSDAELARNLEAQVLLIAWYDEHRMGEGDPSALRSVASPFGDALAGIVLNGVPEARSHYVETELIPAARAASVPLLGAIQQRRLLTAPTLAELVDFLQGEFVAFPEAADELVERIMLGALALDGGIYYYGQAPRKVVITRWDRPDLQMPALATGCQGLILTGGQGPIPYVWDRVQELQVPVAVVPGGTVATATQLNDGLLANRGNAHVRKVQQMADLLDGLPDLLATALGAPTGN